MSNQSLSSSTSNRSSVQAALKAFNDHVSERYGLPKAITDQPDRSPSLRDFAPTDLVRTIDAARLLGLKRKTLENWRVAGKGPQHVRLGSRILYRIRDIDRFITSNVRTSTSGKESLHG